MSNDGDQHICESSTATADFMNMILAKPGQQWFQAWMYANLERTSIGQLGILRVVQLSMTEPKSLLDPSFLICKECSGVGSFVEATDFNVDNSQT